jgi:thioredoxin
MPVIPCTNCGTRNRVDPVSATKSQARCGKCGTPLDLDRKAASGATETPSIVTDASFQRDVLDAKGAPVLLDCWAPWCGPCRMVGPIMEQLAAESKGRYRISKLNVDENPRTAAQFQIQSIPTMLIFKDGKLVDRIIGAQPKQAIAAKLMTHTK